MVLATWTPGQEGPASLVAEVPLREIETSAALSRERTFPRDLSGAPNPQPKKTGSSSQSLSGRKEAKEEQGCGTRDLVAGAWAPVITTTLDELQAPGGATNLDAKISLPAERGNHSKQGRGGGSIPNALSSLNERISVRGCPFLFYINSVDFPPPGAPLVSGWLCDEVGSRSGR